MGKLGADRSPDVRPVAATSGAVLARGGRRSEGRDVRHREHGSPASSLVYFLLSCLWRKMGTLPFESAPSPTRCRVVSVP